jgi:hypothetical protein
MTYSCGFAGMMNADGGGMGMTTDSVIFPLIPHKLIDDATKGTVVNADIPIQNGGWPFGDSDCIPRACGQQACPPPGGALTCDVICCEQSPIIVGTSNISQSIAGGTDYMAASKMLGAKGDADAGASEFPQPLYLVKVESGTTDITGTDPAPNMGGTGGPSLSMANGTIDPAKPLKLSFSCDGSATVGGGCAGQSDIAALLVKTSTSPKSTFAVSMATGSAQCIATLAGGTISISAAQLTALLGTPAQSGGSWQLALARLRLLPTQDGGHLVAFTGGMGVFGFTNQ